MDFGWMVPVIIVIIVISMLASVLVVFGPLISGIFSAYGAVRRFKTEQAPRNHFARWIHAHRRSSIENKPSNLRWMRTTGDTDVPEVYHGWVRGLEAWRSYYLVFVKTRRWAWSECYVIPQWMVSDINGRSLWVTARGFSKTGPIKIPIPLEDHVDLDRHVLHVLDGFRVSFEQQIFTDISEESAWDIDNAMAPPFKDRVRAAVAEQPAMTESTYVPEDTAMGVRK